MDKVSYRTIGPICHEKGKKCWIYKNLAQIFAKKSWFKHFSNSFLSLNVKPMRLLLLILSYVLQIFTKKYEKGEQNNWSEPYFLKT